jgi:hypothetical protein
LLGIRFTPAVDRSTSSRAFARALLAAVFAAAVGSGCVHAAPTRSADATPAPYQVQILEESLRRLAAMGKDASGFRVIIAEHLRHDDTELLTEKGITDDGGIWRVSFTPDVSWSTLPVPTQVDLAGEVTFYFRQPSTEAFAVRDDDDDE